MNDKHHMEATYSTEDILSKKKRKLLAINPNLVGSFEDVWLSELLGCSGSWLEVHMAGLMCEAQSKVGSTPFTANHARGCLKLLV